MYRKQSNQGSKSPSTSRFGGSRPSHGPSHSSGYGSNPRPGSSSGRPSFSSGGRRFPSGGGFRTKNRGPKGENISHSRFINKATVTEEVENFIPEHKFAD